MSLFGRFVVRGGRKRGNRHTHRQTDRQTDTVILAALARRGLISVFVIQLHSAAFDVDN